MATLALVSALTVASAAQAEPTKVYVGVYTYSISEMNIANGTYLFDGYLWFRWKGDALPTDKFEFAIINGAVEGIEDSPVVHQGDVHRSSRRVKLRLRGNFQLHDYPFDRQVLPLQLEHRWMGDEQLVFVPDDEAVPAGKTLREAFLARELAVGDWLIDGVRHRVDVKQYETDFGSIQKGVWAGRSSRYTFDVELKRPMLPYILKVLIPLLLIVTMGFAAFFMSPKEFGTQSAVVITALLSCVAFHVSQANSLPEVGYLVRADLFFLLSYGFIVFALAMVVVTNRFVHREQLPRAERTNRLLGYVLPVGYLFAVTLVAWRS